MTLDQLDQQSDEKLAQMASDSEDAFYLLMQRYEERLLRYIRRKIGYSQENAEDVLQETFVKTYRNINSFDPTLKFSSWIYRIAHNEAISYWRKHKKSDKDISLDKDENGLINILAGGENSDDEVIINEQREKIEKVLHDMPDNYREVLELRYLDEKSYEEISDILQKPVGTVSAMINRAKQKFKDIGLKFKLEELI